MTASNSDPDAASGPADEARKDPLPPRSQPVQKVLRAPSLAPPAILQRQRLRFVLSLGVVAALLGAVAIKRLAQTWAPRATPAQCQALLDRYLEFDSRARQPHAADAERLAALQRWHSRRLLRPAQTSFDISGCLEGLTKAQVVCGLGTTHVDQLERCTQ